MVMMVVKMVVKMDVMTVDLMAVEMVVKMVKKKVEMTVGEMVVLKAWMMELMLVVTSGL